jgi:hypothetical protein
VRRSVYFEEKYGVNINEFKSIDEVDACIEKKTGAKLNVVSAFSSTVDRAGNVLNVRIYNIDGLLDMALG